MKIIELLSASALVSEGSWPSYYIYNKHATCSGVGRAQPGSVASSNFRPYRLPSSGHDHASRLRSRSLGGRAARPRLCAEFSAPFPRERNIVV